MGYTKNDSATARLYKIQTGCPYRLEIVRFFEGSEKDEKEIHEKLKKHRMFGEWFQDNNETRQLLKITNEAMFMARFKDTGRPYSDHVKRIIEDSFEHVQGLKNPRPTPLKDFCKENDVCRETVLANLSRCYIATTTARDLVDKIRFVNCDPLEFDLTQPFIIPYHMAAKNGFSINTWAKIDSDHMTRVKTAQMLCLATLNLDPPTQ